MKGKNKRQNDCKRRNESNTEFSVQFSTPYWLLWYLLTLMFYYLLIPVIATEDKKCAMGILAGTIILAIGAGFDNTIGYYMSLSRTFVFLPFFTCRYYLGHNVFQVHEDININVNRSKIRTAGKILCLFCAFLICRMMYTQNLNGAALYGSLSYAQGELLWYIRLEMLIIAFIWIGIFMAIIPDRKIFMRTDTFPVYVLHGFIVLLLRKQNLFAYSLPVNLFMAAITDVTVILLLGNRYVSRLVRLVFRGEWIEQAWIKR